MEKNKKDIRQCSPEYIGFKGSFVGLLGKLTADR